MVNQQWRLRCQQVSEADVASAIGNVASAAGSAVDVSSAVSESLVANGGGECPGPLEMDLMGHHYSFDFWSHLCEWAGAISVIVMAVAYMQSARILAIGVISNGVT